MKLRYKGLLLAMVVVFPVILLIGIWQAKRQNTYQYPRWAAPAHRERINAIIRKLNNESTKQSMELLIKDDQQYFYPGYYVGVRAPQNDLEIMLSTRRSVKLLQTLTKLDINERRENCMYLFSTALQAHTNAFYRILQHENDASAPVNHQSLGATIEAISAAMFITAEIGEKELLMQQFQDLDQFEKAITPILTNQAAKPNSAAFMMETRIEPDNKFQVNVLYLLAERIEGQNLVRQMDSQCLLAKMTVSEIPVVAWDARTTWFDVLPKSPIDFSKGVIKYRVYDWDSSDLLVGHDRQANLVATLRREVFSGK